MQYAVLNISSSYVSMLDWCHIVCMFKGIVHPEIKISWQLSHFHAIQEADEFVSSSDLEKCSITSLAHLCSEWVPLEWESKQLIKASQ